MYFSIFKWWSCVYVLLEELEELVLLPALLFLTCLTFFHSGIGFFPFAIWKFLLAKIPSQEGGSPISRRPSLLCA